jgi:alkylhydroperoxidase family enzyme
MHLSFLQAAGMPTQTARVLEQQPTRAALEDDLQTLIGLAVRVTEQPDQVSPAEITAAAAAAWSPVEYLDAVAVMIGFNLVTRVANALGVDSDLVPTLRRHNKTRRLTLKVLTLLLRRFVDLRPRQVPLRPAAENLAALQQLFGEIGFEPLPEIFHALADAPRILETQREEIEALFRRGQPAGRIELDPYRFMTTGLVTLAQIGAPGLREAVAHWVRRHGEALPDDLLAKAQQAPARGADQVMLILRFARDVTRWSYRITPERIEELRRAGLRDEDILDLVCTVALWNALGRLEILLPGRSGLPAPARGCEMVTPARDAAVFQAGL